MDSIQLGIHLLLAGLLLVASTTNACSPDSETEPDNEQCLNELPSDYNCTETCDDWEAGGHCTHEWQKSPAHKHCTTSNETIRTHCKKSCDNCDTTSETTEKQNVSTTDSMNSTEAVNENVTTVTQDDGTTMSLNMTTMTTTENTTQDVCSNCTGCYFEVQGCTAYDGVMMVDQQQCINNGGLDCSPDPCANVTCVGGFTCSNGTCLCGGSACDETANFCTFGLCGCGGSMGPCETTSRLSACLSVNGTTAAGDDTTATCQCSGRLTANDTCADTTAADHVGTEPLCGTDGTCGACQANTDGTGGNGTGTGVTDGTMGTCQTTATFCCTDGSCDVSGSCP